MKNNHYHGWRCRHGARVHVNGRSLPRRLDLRKHSMTGFEWGYSGSGPAQLALAILAFEFGDSFAGKHYQDFKREVIAGLGEQWNLGSVYLTEWMLKARARSSAALDLGPGREGGEL